MSSEQSIPAQNGTQNNITQLNPNSKPKQSSAKAPSTMVSVIEEQVQDANMVHILPQPISPGVSRDGTTSLAISSEMDNLDNSGMPTNSIANPTITKLKEEEIERNDSNNKINNKREEIRNQQIAELLNKKASSGEMINVSTLTNPNITEMKLKKATNPSISSLRAMSLQANYPTVSSASTTLTKGSTRAEHFAAKIHDAMKSDTNNHKEEDETFVYDTTTKPPSNDRNFDQNETLSRQSLTVNSHVNKDAEKLRNLSTISDAPVMRQGGSSNSEIIHANIDNASIYKEKLQNVFNPNQSPTSNKFSDEHFETKSKSSHSSRKLRKKSFKNLHNVNNEMSQLQPLSKIDNNDNKSTNQLRQITSRLFDSKTINSRRHSGNDMDYTNDSFDADFDNYEQSLSNQFIRNTQNSQNNPYQSSLNFNNNRINNQNEHLLNSTFDYPRSENIHGNESDYDVDVDGDGDGDGDDFSTYVTTSYGYNNNSNNPNINSIHHHHHHSIDNDPRMYAPNITDYGSIQEAGMSIGDYKKPWRARNDFYNSPHDFTSLRAQRLKQLKGFCYSVTAIFFLLFLGFISGFILATNKELQNLKITEIDNVIVSQEELIFNTIVSAFNPGLVTISIENVQLDIFAKSQFVSTLNDVETTAWETVLLGTIESLDIPLYFQGGFLNRKKDESLTEIKIMHPCTNGGTGDHDDDNSDDGNDEEENDNNNHFNSTESKYALTESGKKLSFSEESQFSDSSYSSTHQFKPDPRWLNISRNPFDLIIRGAMIYKLPFSSQNHTVSIGFTGYLDPSDY